MKGKILYSSIILFMVAGIFLGFTSINDNPRKDQNPTTSKTSTLKEL